MAAYGIEAHNGIFVLSEKLHDIPAVQNPEILNKKIELFIPKSEENTYNKLMNLHSFSQYLISNGITFLNGYRKYGSRFEKAVCVTNGDYNNEMFKKFSKNMFDKVVFNWIGDNLVLEYSSDNTVSTEKEYILTRCDSYHPIIDSHEYKPVYANYQQVLSVLENISNIDGAQSLLEKIELIREQPTYGNHQLMHYFIVVEGLDGTGKSTLTENLARYFKGIAMATPPASLSKIRAAFDGLPELYRRSYYALGNYIASQEVLNITRTKLVVMDRFWHSTTSYAIAKEVGCNVGEYLPPKGHPIYNWPEDLLQPSAIIFLTTKEKYRDSRVNERGEPTAEEKSISANIELRARIMETYRRIGHTKWIEVDTGGTRDETLEKAIKSL